MPKVECVLDAKARLGESAVWDVREAALYWTDIDAGLVHRFDPSSGENRSVDVGEKVGCMALREGGGAVIGTASGIYVLDLESGAKTLIAPVEADKPDNRFNDGAVDRQGRFWMGTYGMMKPQRPGASFYRLDPDHAVTHWRGGIYTTNGLAFSPDGRTMYFSDSYPQIRTVWAADYDVDTGEPHNVRVFFDTAGRPGRPDGATVDADGCYWSAGVGGSELVRLTPAGVVDMVVPVPALRPTRPAFGGPGLDTLFVTSIGGDNPGNEDDPMGGGVFAITGLPSPGVPETRFGG